jgi:hypothetical protein
MKLNLSHAYAKHILRLDDWIYENPLTHSEVIYKGISFDSLVQRSLFLRQLEETEPGTIILIRSFTAGSVSLREANHFTHGSKILYQIYGQDGTFLNESSEEILLARNGKFIYLGYETDAAREGYIIINLYQEVEK